MKEKNRRWIKCFGRLLALSFFGVALGCASTAPVPEYVFIPNVTATQNHQGLVTISWPSRKNSVYRLVAWDGRNVVPDRKTYRGTGEDLVVQFKRDPSKPFPEYKVQEWIGGNAGLLK